MINIKQNEAGRIEHLLAGWFRSINFIYKDNLCNMNSAELERKDLVVINMNDETPEGIEELNNWRKKEQVPAILIADLHSTYCCTKEFMSAPGSACIFSHQLESELIPAARCVLAGDNYSHHHLIRKGQNMNMNTSRTGVLSLTDLEMRVLSYFAAGYSLSGISDITLEAETNIQDILNKICVKLHITGLNELKKFARKNNFL